MTNPWGQPAATGQVDLKSSNNSESIMTVNCETIKTASEAMPTISNPAKILLAYMRCSGISDAKQLATDLDIPIRTIQRLKLECATSGETAKCAIYGAQETPIAPYMAPPDAPNAPYMAFSDVSLACATKESPSEILITNSLSTPLIPQDVEVVAAAVKPPIEKKPSSPNAKRGSRITSDWQLPAEWQTWAQVNFPAATLPQITDQAAQFHDYWIAKPGAMACKLDWQATWRNWCRKGLSAAGQVRRPQYTGSYRDDSKPALPRKSWAEIAREMGVAS